MLNATIRIFPYDGLCGEWFTLGIRVGEWGLLYSLCPGILLAWYNMWALHLSPLQTAESEVLSPYLLFLPWTHCFWITCPKAAFPEVSRALERRCQMKCFLLHKFISLVYILSGHSEAAVFLTVGMSMVMTAQLIHAILYSLAIGSDLVLLSRSYFLLI